MIVVGARGLKGIKRFFLGSVSQKVAHAWGLFGTRCALKGFLPYHTGGGQFSVGPNNAKRPLGLGT